MSVILALHHAATHHFSKQPSDSLAFVKGEGIEGDAHRGVTVKHRSRVKADPTQPNLRQVHFLPVELFEEVAAKGFSVRPGDLGENVTTSGIDLLALPRGTVLTLGASVEVEITGLRNPCQQINDFQPGLLEAVLDRDEAGNLIRKAGIMGIVRNGGVVHVGDSIRISHPPKPFLPLERV